MSGDENITVNEARSLKHAMEEKIRNVVSDFQRETGLRVHDLRVDTWVSVMGRDQPVCHSVKAEVRM